MHSNMLCQAPLLHSKKLFNWQQQLRQSKASCCLHGSSMRVLYLSPFIVACSYVVEQRQGGTSRITTLSSGFLANYVARIVESLKVSEPEQQDDVDHGTKHQSSYRSLKASRVGYTPMKVRVIISQQTVHSPVRLSILPIVAL